MRLSLLLLPGLLRLSLAWVPNPYPYPYPYARRPSVVARTVDWRGGALPRSTQGAMVHTRALVCVPVRAGLFVD